MATKHSDDPSKDGDDATTTTQTQAPKLEQEIFHLNVHATIESQQTQHGVRHDDFAQYHGYCTRRLARLSHAKEAKQHLVCSSKYASAKAPKRHAYCSRLADTLLEPSTNTRTDTDTATATATTNEENIGTEESTTPALDGPKHVPHVNILWYILTLSERAWAQAKDLARRGKRRQQVLAKFKRAVHWAEIFYQKALRVCDTETQQEATAYLAWMQANYAMEKQDYMAASQAYGTAMKLCYSISRNTKNEEETTLNTERSNKEEAVDEAQRLERQDLFVTRADTLLRPLFRYCMYELKQTGHDAASLMEEPRLETDDGENTAKSTKNDEKDEQVFVFRETELILDSKELRVLLLKLHSISQDDSKQPESTEKGRHAEESFLSALSILDDALEVIAAQIAILEKAQVSGPAIQSKLQQYQLWKGYIQYQKTIRVMNHTSQLLETIEGHAERVHVYDALLQHAKSLLLLPRPSDAEEEDEFALQAQANVLRLRALKTFHMSWYYLQTQKAMVAKTMLDHSLQLRKQAEEEIAACDEDMPHADEYLKELESMPYSSARVAIRAALYLQASTNPKTKSATQRPLLLRLKDDDAGMVLSGDLEPMPIPCKPVFYDLALTNVLDAGSSFDVLQNYVDMHTVVEDTHSISQSKGFFGRIFG